MHASKPLDVAPMFGKEPLEVWTEKNAAHLKDDVAAIVSVMARCSTRAEQEDLTRAVMTVIRQWHDNACQEG